MASFNAIQNYIAKQFSHRESESVENIISGQIKSVENGIYTIKLANSNQTISASAFNTSVTYKVEDYVYIIQAVVASNYTYLIFGLVQNTNQDFYSLPISERFTEGTTYSKFDTACINDLKASGAFKISAYITTPSSLSEGDNYGLRVSLWDADGKNFSTYFLDTYWFEGQPFNLNYSYQERVILMTSEDIEKLNKITVTRLGAVTNASEIKITAGRVDAGECLANISVEGLDYIATNNKKIQLSVKVTNNGHEINGPLIKYYWLRKDANAVAANNYLPQGWAILNKTQTVEYIDSSSIEYLTSNNTIELNTKKLSNFINTVKCIAIYRDTVIESREIELINYNKEDFYVELTSNSSSNLLLTTEDKVKLTCEVKTKNNKIDLSKYEFTYVFYQNDSSILESTISQTYFEQTISSKNFNNTDIRELTFHCQVLIRLQEEEVSTEQSNSITVASKIIDLEKGKVEANREYRYWISTKPLLFKVSTPRLSSNNDIRWVEYNPVSDDGILTKGDIEYLGNITVGASQYLYYSMQTTYKENGTIIRKDDYSVPILYKVTDETGKFLDSEYVSQLNTFYQLTQGGSKEGLMVTDGDVYLNASFINTGTLLVGDPTNPLFLARIQEEEKNGETLSREVRIAGWNVTQDTLQSSEGKVGLSSGETNLPSLVTEDTSPIRFFVKTKNENQEEEYPVAILEDGSAYFTKIQLTGQVIITDAVMTGGTIGDLKETVISQEEKIESQKNLINMLNQRIDKLEQSGSGGGSSETIYYETSGAGLAISLDDESGTAKSSPFIFYIGPAEGDELTEFLPNTILIDSDGNWHLTVGDDTNNEYDLTISLGGDLDYFLLGNLEEGVLTACLGRKDLSSLSSPFSIINNGSSDIKISKLCINKAITSDTTAINSITVTTDVGNSSHSYNIALYNNWTIEHGGYENVNPEDSSDWIIIGAGESIQCQLELS